MYSSDLNHGEKPKILLICSPPMLSRSFLAIRGFQNVYFTRNNWLKVSTFEEEIKVKLFINPILFSIGRGCSQTVNCQLSTVNCQLLKHFKVIGQQIVNIIMGRKNELNFYQY
jgi:hypothetical protein